MGFFPTPLPPPLVPLAAKDLVNYFDGRTRRHHFGGAVHVWGSIEISEGGG